MMNPFLDVGVPVAFATWATIVGLALIAGVRRKRQSRNVIAAHRLLQADPSANPEAVGRATRRVSLPGFQALVRLGLVNLTEQRVAVSVRDSIGAERLQRRARGLEGDDWARIEALEVLVASEDPHRHDLLAAALRTDRRNVRASAVRLLGRLNDRKAVAVLVNAMCRGEYSRSRLAAVLARMTAASADLLTPLLERGDEIVRFWGIRLLARTDARDALPRIREMARDRNPLVRRAVMEALGRLGSAEDKAVLLAHLKDSSPIVRLHGARACAAFADGETAEAVGALLCDREWIVRAAARDALQRMNAVALPTVARMLWHPDRFAANNAAEILHRTGAAAEAARQVAQGGAAPQASIDMLAGYMKAGGPHLRAALLDALDESERRQVLDAVAEHQARLVRRAV